MPGRHPCERGRRCSCHRAGPSTPKKKTTLVVAAATASALVCPVLAAPTPPSPRPTHFPFLYPALEKRVTDAGQAPDDPSEGFTHEHIQLADLIRAGLPYKYVYDPDANLSSEQMEEDTKAKELDGAWVIDNTWSLHGRRFGPLYATATAGITDEPLPTPTESIPPASTPTTTTTPPPTVLAIQSSLPTGWDASQYERSEMYAIPLVVSFALVIALMIGSLIGAMVIRRDRSRSRRRKKRITQQDDDDSAREKVAQSSLVARVGRALKLRDRPNEEPEQDDPRSELEQRVKTWARRSAAWRVQARFGVRRRMGRGRKRSQADMSGPDTPMGGAIQEEPEPEDEARNSTRAPTPAQSRAPTPIVTEHNDPPPSAAPNYSSPIVPTYSSPPDAAGPSTPSPLARMEAHPDASPSDEPAYDGPGAGDGLPPAYRGGGLSEVARGKRPAHASSESVHEPRRDEQAQAQQGEPETQAPRVWTELDAYAYGQNGQGDGVTAHVATDDKQVLERLHSMRGAPDQLDGREEEERVQAPRAEDVFAGGSGLSNSEDGSLPPSGDGAGTGTGALPLPPTKTGTGPVARYGEADLSLPRYLDGESREGMPAGMGMGVPEVVPGVLEGMVPSAPPCEEPEGIAPSAPALEDASAPLDQDGVPSAPPLDDHPSAPPLDDHPSAPPLDHSLPSAPPSDDHPTPSAPPLHDDTLHPYDTSLPPTPHSLHLQRFNSTCPLLGEDR
ncbi:unnamed protein product [Rhizoctonia solani]|uniref:Transmembrane protein n=1 Tax=Rhizoctonia solani TaxID=456999 RepID=A0A8H2Y125_9AGAM|nr:unnamed protein product [Rhizoctonia solani]